MRFVHFITLVCGVVIAIVAVGYWGGKIETQQKATNDSLSALTKTVGDLSDKLDAHIMSKTSLCVPACSSPLKISTLNP